MKFDPEGIQKNSGRVVGDPDEKPLAVYRDSEGKLHTFSATCPHEHCTVKWNDTDKTWDCPCHGSRFEAGGALKRGPADRGLYPKEFHK